MQKHDSARESGLHFAVSLNEALRMSKLVIRSSLVVIEELNKNGASLQPGRRTPRGPDLAIKNCTLRGPLF
jgi:hypothetical protein